MRRMLLGIYLVLLAIPALLMGLLASSWFWFIAAILLAVVSAWCFMDGYFTFSKHNRHSGSTHCAFAYPSFFR